MYLFIDTISYPATFVLFDTDRRTVARQDMEIRGSESERFFDVISEFVSVHGSKLSELQGIVTVNGPGGFTSTRIVTLSVNTIAFVHQVPLFSIDYFELLRIAGVPYPQLLRANRGEYLVRSSETEPMRIVSLGEIPAGAYRGIGEENDFENGRISIQSGYDLEWLLWSLDLSHPTDRIEPVYVKKPNIVIKPNS